MSQRYIIENFDDTNNLDLTFVNESNSEALEESVTEISLSQKLMLLYLIYPKESCAELNREQICHLFDINFEHIVSAGKMIINFPVQKKRLLLRLILPKDYCGKLSSEQVAHTFDKKFETIVSAARNLFLVNQAIESDALTSYNFWRNNDTAEEFLTVEEISSAYGDYTASSVINIALLALTKKLPK